ncbi:GL19834 [Drosophila persimilis]|uniref:GL19834 n=1 Tax=Drosophila persimilis TaxID=7234 RepID=B4GYB4_DROPE|nr:GL19834 [Drosophila persimilis]
MSSFAYFETIAHLIPPIRPTMEHVLICLNLTPEKMDAINESYISDADGYGVQVRLYIWEGSTAPTNTFPDNLVVQVNAQPCVVPETIVLLDDAVRMTPHMPTMISLNCPVSMKKIQVPCRGLNCSHFLCFDAGAYIEMNERLNTWECPVCHKGAPFEDLVIDGANTPVPNRKSPTASIHQLAKFAYQTFPRGGWDVIAAGAYDGDDDGNGDGDGADDGDDGSGIGNANSNLNIAANLSMKAQKHKKRQKHRTKHACWCPHGQEQGQGKAQGQGEGQGQGQGQQRLLHTLNGERSLTMNRCTLLTTGTDYSWTWNMDTFKYMFDTILNMKIIYIIY